ncbi:sulfatase [Roseimicrobium sp. ORNL1]|uniref:sulfatase n=1 Tax=Roseimicrobium sp. ORNL1 TaxID=2711231 RepID=UPI0013E1C76B|nr:sulfatase [Roseimicrobium sp. ORNL1]QIF03593.1 sulfatase [Roseimicrobium sp. ORNL1]
MFKRLVITAASTISRAIAFLAGAAALATSATTTAATTSTPNIVFIMADDLGYTDVHCFGSQYYETPNIDRLAEQGMKLTSYHQCQNCQPTRAALMTGQYGPRTGVYTVGGIERFDWRSRPLRPVDNVDELPLEKKTVAESMKAAGYATGMFGKWHLGNDGAHHPGERGFDEAIVSMGKHFNFNTNPEVEVPEGAYLADFLTDKAVDFITRHKDKPFFLYLPHFGVHSPHEAKKDLIEHFKPKAPAGGHDNPTYAAMIASVDESVGRVMETLEKLGLAENTVLIFTSDNGGVGGYAREGIKKAGDVTDNAPLRSGKGSLYEGGTRVPFVVRWPGVVKPGSTSDVPAIHVDIFPTLLELAKGTAPEGQVLDGESLVPLFRGGDVSGSGTAKLKREAIYQHFPGYLGAGENSWRTTPVAAVISGDWKLMEFMEDKRVELYNLKEDIGETKNLATTEPEKAKALLEKLHTWQQEIKAPMPTPNTEQGQPTPEKKGGKGKGKGKKAKAAAAGAADE